MVISSRRTNFALATALAKCDVPSGARTRRQRVPVDANTQRSSVMFFRKKRGKLVAIVAGAGLLAVSAPLAMEAGANTLVSGSVTLSTIGTVTTGAPYSSGQTIDISVAANSTLSLSNLE